MWLDRRAHFSTAIQHIAGSTLKFNDFLCKNPAAKMTVEDVNDAQYVINISEHLKKIKCEALYADQSQNAPEKNKNRNRT